SVRRKLTSRLLIQPALHSAHTPAVTRAIRRGAFGDGVPPGDALEGTSRPPRSWRTSQRAKTCSRVIGWFARRHNTHDSGSREGSCPRLRVAKHASMSCVDTCSFSLSGTQADHGRP